MGLIERRSRGRVSWKHGALAWSPARTTLGWALAGRPRLRLEDKGATIAVHFREAPGEEMYVQQLLDALAARLGSDFEVLDGSLVKELRSKAGDKGEAVRRFMGARPFIGRMPVYVGDDTTDLDGFRVVESLGGVTIAVGERIAGQYRLRSPAAVQTLAGSAGRSVKSRTTTTIEIRRIRLWR
jgi:trehalose 6-phosphate phosphatase